MNIKNDKKRSLGKRGAIEVENIVTMNNSIYHGISQENDIGIDCQIELIDESDSPMDKIIAAQIKTGDSYFNSNKDKSIIPIGKHYKYWSKHPLPVFGIACRIVNDKSDIKCYWTDIKEYLKTNEDAIFRGDLKNIKFDNTCRNEFSNINFKKYFVPYIFNKPPILDFMEIIELINSDSYNELELAIASGFYYYHDKIELWREYLKIFKENRQEDIPSYLIYILSHIPWHFDLWKKVISAELKKELLNDFKKFNEYHVKKLLYFVDENGFERGSIGQCVEALIHIIPNYKNIISKIISNDEIQDELRNSATVFYYQDCDTDETLRFLSEINRTEFMDEFCEFLCIEKEDYNSCK